MKAFILLGLRSQSKDYEFFNELEKRKIRILCIDSNSSKSKEYIENTSKMKDHIFNKIEDSFLMSPRKSISEALSRINSWKRTYNIIGVYSNRESFKNLESHIAVCMGLKNPGLIASTVSQDKTLQRFYLKEYSPNYTIRKANSNIAQSTLKLNYPIIIKPTKRDSSSGVLLLNSITELEECIDTYKNEDVLFESYIDGKEYSVECLIQNKKIIFSSITEKETTANTRKYFVETQHTVPARKITRTMKGKLLSLNKKIIEKLEFENGISHAEYKIDKKNKVYLIEIASRAPGDSILHAYKLSTGKSLTTSIIDILTGKPAYHPSPKKIAREIFILHQNPGKLVNININKKFSEKLYWHKKNYFRPDIQPNMNRIEPHIHEISIEKLPSESLHYIKKSSDRIGSVLIDAQNQLDIEKLTRLLNLAIVPVIEQ